MKRLFWYLYFDIYLISIVHLFGVYLISHNIILMSLWYFWNFWLGFGHFYWFFLLLFYKKKKRKEFFVIKKVFLTITSKSHGISFLQLQKYFFYYFAFFTFFLAVLQDNSATIFKLLVVLYYITFLTISWSAFVTCMTYYCILGITVFYYYWCCIFT
jgi:hypothetical protein